MYRLKLLFKSSKSLPNLFGIITASTIVLITLLSLIFYFNAQLFIERALFDSYFGEFTRTQSILESLTEDMRSHLTYLNTTDDVYALINSSTSQRSAERRALTSVSKYRNSNPIIYSIYMYNKNLDRYYVVSGQNQIRDAVFFDSEITDIIKNPSSYDFSEPISRSIPKNEFSSAETIDVFTYILPENYNSQNKNKSYIIINVLADDILKYVFSNSKELNETAFFYDTNKNRVICSDFSEASLADSSLLGKQIAEKEAGSDYFIYTLSEKKYLTAYTKLTNVKWSLIKLTPYASVSTHIRSFRITTLVIVLLMILLSLLYSVFAFHKFYKPIGSIFEKIQKITSDYSNKTFTNISESVDALHEEISHLNSFKQKNAYLIKNETLKSFIFTGNENDISLLNSVKDNIGAVVLTLIKIDNYNNFNEELSYSDRMLYKYSFINILEEIIGTNFKCDFIDISEDSIAGIIQITSVNKQTLKELFSKVQDALLKNFNISVSVFISETINLPACLSDVYENLYGISLYRFILGKGCILFSEDFDESRFRNTALDSEDIKQLSNEIRMHHYEAVIKELHNIVLEISQLNYPAAKMSIYNLLTNVFSALISIEKNSNHSLEINYTTLIDKMSNNLETLEEIENECKVLLNRAFNAIDVRKTNKMQHLISQIYEYVSKNYSDANLSSAQIADEFNLSTRYLTKIFLENTSVSLTNYITNYRIEKSKEYLINTDLSIKEIVEKIGWINLKYFYTMFKKVTGVTPGDFRTSGGQNTNNN